MMALTRLSLSSPLFMIQTSSVELSPTVHIIILRLLICQFRLEIMMHFFTYHDGQSGCRSGVGVVKKLWFWLVSINDKEILMPRLFAAFTFIRVRSILSQSRAKDWKVLEQNCHG